MAILVRHLREDDRHWADEILKKSWGGLEIVARGRKVDSGRLPGLVAEDGRKRIGLLILDLQDQVCEIVSMNSLVERKGVGTALIEAAASFGLAAGCTRLMLCTTNDNVTAIRFYQKRNFHISAVNLDIMKQYRELKPAIPQTGQDGIPIRDEIVLERTL